MKWGHANLKVICTLKETPQNVERSTPGMETKQKNVPEMSNSRDTCGDFSQEHSP